MPRKLDTYNRKKTQTSFANRGFTLVELLIVIMVIAILAAVTVPLIGSMASSRLGAASRLIAADIEFAQTESVANPGALRILKVDKANNRYWVALASTPDTPLDNPGGSGAMLTTFGSGRAAQVAGVTISAHSLDGDDTLQFGAFGQPDQTTDATITLSDDGLSITITVDSETGEVTVSSIG